MDKLKKIGKINLFCGIAYIAAVIVLWILTYCGGYTITPAEGLENIVLIISIVVFVAESVLMTIAGIYCISGGAAYIKVGKEGKKAGKITMVSAVVKIISAGISVFFSVLLCNILMPLPGAVGLTVSAVLTVTAVLDIKEFRREKKNRTE